ncbi:N-acetylmuramic acid 6-phosphate etherase [Levilactobacillus brevis]|uniref:N-acetylmuramic acid 6-phosphate etherase n=1 Tax=Levilactobacillus brevis TaxID=1580 RepID=UPI001C1EF77B|nr:N-acetylmuramic acid 6-phosphate etherase [Levilactobacillus brevis]MBU7538693.1 N-acetylmuramic acid 6-phosphate etherase [Levilactobacillus brevis]MBU7558334.1 N-acetylmuramic acid 6-phosphate etherase [Levilactobacillus brevis]MBU7564852.1 N-acetylmuramic acid 6-phosphate etherase [Levilactobacillus brevis]MCE6009905.1 N-acetylmuramic acid 6-phosphate etherase [Levilactobacillus brevis]MCE6012176.1 N-acetylmuramic acid 6-phosphate etherase [Levilactobacillus brevis]
MEQEADTMQFDELLTEQRNHRSTHIDRESTLEMVATINREDHRVARAVQKELPRIAAAIDAAYPKFDQGGRLIYVGAGTSGRLGVMDATEIQPTYGLTAEQTFGLIAGGEPALTHTVKAAEDSIELAQADLAAVQLTAQDIVVASAASGQTPYTVAALQYAQEKGALGIGFSCVEDSPLARLADYPITPVVGPEVITGATLLKAGTAEKMVLNMLSTGIMVKSGKVYQNLMINVVPTNGKTFERAKKIIAEATQTSLLAAERALERANNHVPLAIVLIETKGTIAEAKALLAATNGHVSQAVKLNDRQH